MARKTKKTAVSTKDLHRMIAEPQAALDTERLDHCATRSLAAIQLKACEVLQKLLIKALDLLDTHCASLLLKGEIMIDALLREVELDAKELEELPGLERVLRRSFKQFKGKIEPKIEEGKTALAEAEDELARRRGEAVKAALNKKRTIGSNDKKSTEAKAAVGNAVIEEAEKHSDNELLHAAAEIARAEVPSKSSKTAPLLGKQADPNRRNAPVLKSSAHGRCCPYCGEKEAFIEVEGPNLFMRMLHARLEEYIKPAHVKNPVPQCRACGKHHMHIAEDMPVPVDLNRTVGQDLLFDCARMLTMGMPMNRVNAIFDTAALSMSPDTIPRNMHHWMTSGLGRPLLKAILKKARKAAEACVDETPFSRLQQAGMSKKKLEDEDIARQACLLTITSPASAGYQFAVFDSLRSRSAEAIEGVLRDYQATTWITDAYGAYSSIISRSETKIERQSCLAHFTRVVYDSLNLENMSQAVTNPENREKLAEALESGTPAYYLLMVTDAIGKIYKWEATLKAGEDEDPADWMKRVNDCRSRHAEPLMTQIDKIMVKLAETYAVQKKGRTWEAARVSPYAKPIVYYMNNRKNFGIFLKNPYVTPDSSAAERSLRPLCVLRNSCNFKQSPEYMQSMCDWYTVFVTARLNGIEKPTKWLKEYGRAIFQHCVNEELNRRSDDGLDLARKFEFDPQDIKSFDADAWEPSTYMERLRQEQAGS